MRTLPSVGRVLEELFHHLAPDAGVGAALDLDERRRAVSVSEEVVDAPPLGPRRFVGEALLA